MITDINQNIISTAKGNVKNINELYEIILKNNDIEKPDIIGFENIELISDRSLDVWLDVFKRIKDKHPDKILIASLTTLFTCSVIVLFIPVL